MLSSGVICNLCASASGFFTKSTEQAGEMFSVSIWIYLCMPKNTVYIKSPGLCKIPAKSIYSKTACACKPKAD